MLGTWEDQIYSKGLQLNRYPFDSVVSTVLRAKPSLPVPLTALDLGSGTGNHLKFFAENGFDVRELLRSGSEEALRLVLEGIWKGRTDRYSEERGPRKTNKVEMSYIGG